MSNLGDWWKAKARKTELNKQVETETGKFNTAIKLAEAAAGKLADRERREGVARVQELRDIFETSRLEKDLEKRVAQLTQLVKDVDQRTQALTPRPGPPQQPPPQRPTPPAPPSSGTLVESVRKLLGEVDAIVIAAGTAQLPVPALLTNIANGARPMVVANANTPTNDVLVTRDALAAVVAAKDRFLGFIEAWKTAEAAEQQARLALPDPKALFAQFEVTWPKSLEMVKTSWTKIANAAGVDSPIQKLQTIQGLLASNRKGLIERHQAASSRIEEITKGISDASALKLYELSKPRLLLARARTEFVGADTPDKLQATMKTLQDAADALQAAKTGLSDAKVAALEQFAKRRRRLSDQLAAARLVRGALDKSSAVAEQIAAIEAMLQEGDAMLARALVSAHVMAACEQLDKAIGLDIDKKADKLGKALKLQTETDLAALPRYQELYGQLVKVRAEVAQIPGGHKELQLADALLLQTRVAGSGKPEGGFAAAATLLTQANIGLFKTRAVKSSGEFIGESLSEAAKTALKAAQDALGLYKLVHTPFEADAQQRALAIASQQPDPVTALDQLTTTLKQTTADQQTLKQKMRVRVEAITQRLDALKTAGLAEKTPDMLEMKRQLDLAETLRIDSRLNEAESRIAMLEELSSRTKTDFEAAKAGWEQTKIALVVPLERAAGLSNVPGEIGLKAAGLIGDHSILTTRLAKGELDFRGAVASGKRLIATGEALDLQAVAAQFVAGFDVGAFNLEATRLMGIWTAKVAEVQQDIDVLDLALRDRDVKGGAASTPYPKELAALQKRRAAAEEKLKAEANETPTAALTRAHTALVDEINLFLVSLPNPSLPNTPEFAKVVTDGRQNDAIAACQSAHRAAEQALVELQALSGLGQSVLEGELVVLKAKAPSAQVATELAELARKIVVAAQTQRVETRKNKAPVQEKGKELKGEMGKKLLSIQSVTFRALFEELGKRVEDALAMLETDDPALIATAERQIAEIRLTLDGAKGKGIEGGATLEAVGDAWASLAETLNGKAVVQSRLPDTYARLKAQLDKAIDVARRVPPEKGLAELEKLRGPIGDAREKGEQVKVRYEAFKLRREQLEAQFDTMKGHAGATLLGGRTKAFNERFESRLGEAHSLARQEGQIEAAEKALLVMETELQGLLDLKPDAAREKLQGLDAEAELERRELRDLARNWNNTQEYWDDTLLPAIEKAVAERDEDDTEFESLKAAIANIAKSLDPYLAVVSLVPHKRGLSNGAPDMKTARAAFSQAYMRVGQLSKAAVRLRDGAGTTNVDLENDLEKLEQEWVLRVTNARGTLSQLVKDFGGLPAQASNKSGDANFLAVPDLTTLTESVEQIKPLLSNLSERLSNTAFSEPFGVLRRATTTPAERKKAREQALRTVRQIRADIVDNQLVQELFEGAAQNLLEVDPRPPISFLRAALKKVELAALVGI